MTQEDISKYRLTYIIRIAAALYLIYMVFDSLTNTEIKSHMTLNIVIAIVCAAFAVLFLVTGIKGFQKLSVEQRLLDERMEREEQERKEKEEIRKEKEEKERNEKLNTVKDKSSLLTFDEE